MRYDQSPDPSTVPPGQGDKIMHASFKAGDTEIMASDDCGKGNIHFEGFALSIAVSSPEEAERCFHGLSEGGEVRMPLTQTFFSQRFGMLADKFGVGWMIIVM
jgi:PhnB protein